MSLLAQSISAGYSDLPILQDISLEVNPGTVTGVLGPNGAGKTTLLRALSGLIPLKSGQVTLEGMPLETLSHRRRAQTIAWVQQREMSPFSFTVREWVDMGRYCHTGALGKTSREDREAVSRALDTCDLIPLQHRSLSSLSGGEAQRAHIARALAQDARFLFLDEPMTHLDLKYQAQILQILKKLTRETGRGLLCVLHDLNFAASFCQDLILLKAGRTYGQGPAGELLQPELLSELYETRIQDSQTALVPDLEFTPGPSSS